MAYLSSFFAQPTSAAYVCHPSLQAAARKLLDTACAAIPAPLPQTTQRAITKLVEHELGVHTACNGNFLRRNLCGPTHSQACISVPGGQGGHAFLEGGVVSPEHVQQTSRIPLETDVLSPATSENHRIRGFMQASASGPTASTFQTAQPPVPQYSQFARTMSCSSARNTSPEINSSWIGAATSCPAVRPLQSAHRRSTQWRQAGVRMWKTGNCMARRNWHNLSLELRNDIEAAATKRQTGVSLKYLLDFGTQPLERQMLLSARFLHVEFPIRLAHRLMDLNQLPTKLSDEPHVRRVKGWYAESFADFRNFPTIRDNEDVIKFTTMLKAAFRRHNNVVPAIAKGVEVYKRELERTGESTHERETEIQHFLDTFFLSRIAIRFLAGHHISMFEPARADHIGLVHTKCSPFMVASDAVAEARAMCFREYGGAPSVTVLGNSELTMAYVPSHLHHMVFELVKNSLRAVQERYADSEEPEPPSIQVVVAEGLEDVTIKVSDQGGGIPRSGLQRIWTYLYTTARSPLPDVDIDSSNMPAVLAGYGCGLPLSRLYARYFGGDLQIISMEGYGTDAYLHLARLGNDEEPMPGAVLGDLPAPVPKPPPRAGTAHRSHGHGARPRGGSSSRASDH